MNSDDVIFGVIVGLAIGIPLALILYSTLRPASVAVGQPISYQNAEEWEVKYNEAGDVSKIIIHRDAKQT